MKAKNEKIFGVYLTETRLLLQIDNWDKGNGKNLNCVSMCEMKIKTKNPQLTNKTKGVTTDGNENKKKNVQFQQHKWIFQSS